MDTFEVLIIGGSAAGLSCALILGSAVHKPFASNKKIGIVVHQKSSALNEAILNNVLGLKKGTRGDQVLADGRNQLSDLYPHVIQIDNEKVTKIEGEFPNFTVITNKNSYLARCRRFCRMEKSVCDCSRKWRASSNRYFNIVE